MIRLVLACLLVAGVAHADPVKPPASWTADQPLADAQAKRQFEMPHFAGLRSLATAKVFRAPEPHRVALFVTRIEANVAADTRDISATAELDEVRGAMLRAGAKPDSSSQRADPAAKQLEAAVVWRDVSTGIATSSRIVIAGDKQRLVAVLGECVMPVDAATEVATACSAALGTLDPEVPPASRVPLAIIDVMAGVGSGSSAPSAGSGSGRPSDGPRLGATGPRATLAPMTVPPDRETDRRPIYIGGGLVVLALIFYWNRRRRDRLERGDEARPADDDADDLHAAAEPHVPGGDDDEHEDPAPLLAALAEDPKSIALHDRLGELYEAQKRWIDLIAILDAKVALVKEPAEEVAIRVRIAKLATEQLADSEQARQSWKQVLDLEPEHAEAQAELAKLEEKDKS